jgi:anti-sigma factor RsiW
MKTDDCRDWRQLLGAYALGDLGAEERAGLEAHLEGCPSCRAEAEALGTVAQLLPLADPDRFSHPAPQPSPDLGQRIAATIGGEQRVIVRRRRWRFGLALSGAAAAAAAVVAAAPSSMFSSASCRAASRSTRRWSPTPTEPRSTCT